MKKKKRSKLKVSNNPALIRQLKDLVREYCTLPSHTTSQRASFREGLIKHSSFIDFIIGGIGNPEEYIPGFNYNYHRTHQRHLKYFFPDAFKAVYDFFTGNCEKRSGLFFFKKNFTSFEELHDFVKEVDFLKKTNEKLKGFGKLDIYDFSLRYSYNRDKTLLPKEYVYVNHGNTYHSALLLYVILPDFPEIIEGKIKYDDCPDWLRECKTPTGTYTMYSMDIENFLCHKYKEIVELVSKYYPEVLTDSQKKLIKIKTK